MKYSNLNYLKGLVILEETLEKATEVLQLTKTYKHSEFVSKQTKEMHVTILLMEDCGEEGHNEDLVTMYSKFFIEKLFTNSNKVQELKHNILYCFESWKGYSF